MAVKYRVEFAEPAAHEILDACNWIGRGSAEAAERWREGLLASIDSLSTMPERYPLAPESAEAPEEIRQMLYGKRSGVYRVLYSIRGKSVTILHCRHGARRHLLGISL